jgi:ATP-dependent Clp protease ATP-binding subunit ClpC
LLFSLYSKYTIFIIKNQGCFNNKNEVYLEDMKREIIPKVKRIINESMVIARDMDDVNVRPEHITLSIIKDNNNKCVDVLEALGVDINALYDSIYDNLNKSDLTPRLVNAKKLKRPFCKITKLIFNSVDEECDGMHDTMIDTTHLMLAILKNNTQSKKVILNVGVNYKSFKQMIKQMREDIENSASEEDYDFGQDGGQGSKKPKGKTTVTKTPVLDNFCRDISKAVDEGKIDHVIGREKEIKRVSQILSRRKKNNPILIGEPGVGKTSIVEGLAQLIKDGKAPITLLDKKLYSLDLASIVAGTKYRGQFEERMKAILEELKKNPDVVLFIDEIHTIVGAGNASGSLDASNIFKPALARGEVQVIGATTLDEFRENIEKDGALTRRFQQVLIEEPSLEETITILKNIRDKYEDHHKVTYTDEAIEECVKMADRYISDRAMPDKAIDIMDEAGSSTNVNVEVPENIKKLELEIGKIKEEKMVVVTKQKYEKAAALRDEERKINNELVKAKDAWVESMAKEQTIVDVHLISEVVSMMTGIPLSKISTQESKKLLDLDTDLTGRVIGQDDAVNKVVKAIKRSRIGIKDRKKPIGSFIFLGPTGVGKTYLAKLLAEHVFGDDDNLLRMDMSEYMEKFSVSRLIGPPPGYVGYEEGGQLTEKVRRKPHSVILFDEIEKAHDDVFNLLLQLLDEGHLTDGLGRKVNFRNTLIIMTSNIGVKELSQFGKGLGFNTGAEIANEEERARNIIEKALKKKFKPEFLNRIDDTIVFNGLSSEDIHKIIYNELENLEERINEMGFELKLGENAIKYLADKGYDPEYGARPLARTIQRYVEDPIADEVLSGNASEGDTLRIDYDEKSDKILIKVIKKKKPKTK